MQNRTRRLASVAALCGVAACVGPVPLRPSTSPELQIQGTTLLMVGGRGRLTAWRPGGGELREVDATWTSDSDAISLTRDGRVTALRLGAASVQAQFEDLVGTGTVHVVGSVAGIWRGSIAIVQCWQPIETVPDPCEGRRGGTAPLVLNVTQKAAADLYDNLRATVEVFEPPATGSFVGAVDSSGLFFLEGYVQRPADSLGGAVRLRWQLDGDRLVPFTADGRVEDTIDVQLTVRTGSDVSLVSEIWQLSTMTR
jgi:hypothetical protein